MKNSEYSNFYPPKFDKLYVQALQTGPVKEKGAHEVVSALVFNLTDQQMTEPKSSFHKASCGRRILLFFLSLMMQKSIGDNLEDLGHLWVSFSGNKADGANQNAIYSRTVLWRARARIVNPLVLLSRSKDRVCCDY